MATHSVAAWVFFSANKAKPSSQGSDTTATLYPKGAAISDSVSASLPILSTAPRCFFISSILPQGLAVPGFQETGASPGEAALYRGLGWS